MSVELLLLGHVGQVDESPGHDAGPTVEEQLEVEPLADAGVELDAHHVVVEDVSCELAATGVTERWLKTGPLTRGLRASWEIYHS